MNFILEAISERFKMEATTTMKYELMPETNEANKIQSLLPLKFDTYLSYLLIGSKLLELVCEN